MTNVLVLGAGGQIARGEVQTAQRDPGIGDAPDESVDLLVGG